MATIAERVARGAAFLDVNDRGWWREDVPNAIDLDALDLNDGDLCVLGQRCPMAQKESEAGYHAQLRAVTHAGEGVLDEVLEAWAAEMGFTFPLSTGRCNWSQLTAEWRRVITERRDSLRQVSPGE